jgi:hypothetical protein
LRGAITDTGCVRKAVQWLSIFGVVAFLAAWPLWHVVRSDVSGCGDRGTVCDPGTYLPYGGVALGLTVMGVLALASVVILLLVALVVSAVRQDRRERAAK